MADTATAIGKKKKMKKKKEEMMGRRGACHQKRYKGEWMTQRDQLRSGCTKAKLKEERKKKRNENKRGDEIRRSERVE